ncbi:hypothetical protein CEXT_781221 [Caerostris extrusa]|uniref:Uncharacterized protein n=1 Tax=Caerostris extrusa TaxID=172846 RepID=A0AAV4QEH5_CAEEX|nr:hypothetical protein CEXT_781221 [Caerostris extrusa]
MSREWILSENYTEAGQVCGHKKRLVYAREHLRSEWPERLGLWNIPQSSEIQLFQFWLEYANTGSENTRISYARDIWLSKRLPRGNGYLRIFAAIKC